MQSWTPTKINNEMAAQLHAHVHTLSEKIGDRNIYAYAHLREAADYISEQFTVAGYGLEFQEFTVQGKDVKNIIATKQGVVRPNEIILVGAHYDTCFNPGADDNASAVAGLLELAVFFRQRETNRTVTFVAFVNEEPPFYKSNEMGSRVYAARARDEGHDIKAAIVLEMIGYYNDKPFSQEYPPFLGFLYPNRANFIAMVGNWMSRKLVKDVITRFKRHTDFPVEKYIGPTIVPGIDFSDHWSFWQEGYPAVMITDTAFYRYPDYHRATDTHEKLQYDRMAVVVEALGKVLTELAG